MGDHVLMDEFDKFLDAGQPPEEPAENGVQEPSQVDEAALNAAFAVVQAVFEQGLQTQRQLHIVCTRHSDVGPNIWSLTHNGVYMSSDSLLELGNMFNRLT